MLIPPFRVIVDALTCDTHTTRAIPSIEIVDNLKQTRTFPFLGALEQVVLNEFIRIFQPEKAHSGLPIAQRRREQRLRRL